MKKVQSSPPELGHVVEELQRRVDPAGVGRVLQAHGQGGVPGLPRGRRLAALGVVKPHPRQAPRRGGALLPVETFFIEK